MGCSPGDGEAATSEGLHPEPEGLDALRIFAATGRKRLQALPAPNGHGLPEP